MLHSPARDAAHGPISAYPAPADPQRPPAPRTRTRTRRATPSLVIPRKSRARHSEGAQRPRNPPPPTASLRPSAEGRRLSFRYSLFTIRNSLFSALPRPNSLFPPQNPPLQRSALPPRPNARHPSPMATHTPSTSAPRHLSPVTCHLSPAPRPRHAAPPLQLAPRYSPLRLCRSPFPVPRSLSSQLAARYSKLATAPLPCSVPSTRPPCPLLLVT